MIATKPSGKRILVIGAMDISLFRFRGRMIEAMVGAGHEVFAAAPEFTDAVREQFIGTGATLIEFPMARTGFNPLEDIRTYKALVSLVQEHQIDLVFPYTTKPVVYGSMAAKKAGVKALSLITGLGYTFAAQTPKAKLMRQIVVRLYRKALVSNEAVIFQNRDDMALFKELNITPSALDCSVVDGSGVDLTEFAWREPRGEAGLKFVFAARLIEEKGIDLFLDAAKRLKADWPKSEFHVLGNPQPGSPSAVSMDKVEALVKDEVIVYHGRRNDIVEVLAEMDVFVAPSWYREGVPRSILEALSTGLAIITTDTPGCRETVIASDEGVENGYLLPPRDGEALYAAMNSLLQAPEQVAVMSRRSRELAETKFDVKLINRIIIEKVGQALEN